MTALLALFLTAATLPAAVGDSLPTAVPVVATAYACDAHPNNRMFPCNTTRWGADPNSPGIAAPPDWRGKWLYIPSIGFRRVDDTGRYDYLNGLPHVDIRMGYGEAVIWGLQTIVIYEIAPRGQERKGA